MKNSIAWLALSVLIFSSCERQEDDDSPQPSQLYRMVEKTGSDSVVTEYSYDGSGRLILKKQSGTLSGNNMYEEVKITRVAGAITRIVEKAAYLTASGTDSVVTRFNYNSSSFRYVYSIMETDTPGATVYDSVVYNYDGFGRIIRDVHYQSVSAVPFTQVFKQEYVYSAANNIDSVKNFDYNAGSYTLSNYISYLYDTKYNGLRLLDECVLLYLFTARVNNPTQVKSVFLSNPSMNYTANTTYNYHSHDVPASAATTKTPGNPSTTVFYYQ